MTERTIVNCAACDARDVMPGHRCNDSVVEILYELGSKFWHTNCPKNSLRSGIMRPVAYEPTRSLIECLHCGQRAYYPVGGVGKRCSPLEPATSVNAGATPVEEGVTESAQDSSSSQHAAANEKAATPGPWFQSYRPDRRGMYSTDIYDAAGETIATCAWYPVPYDGGICTNRSENAAFIVRACNCHHDLLAAAKATLEYWEATGFAECDPDCRCIVEQTRDAIRKAEGR